MTHEGYDFIRGGVSRMDAAGNIRNSLGKTCPVCKQLEIPMAGDKFEAHTTPLGQNCMAGGWTLAELTAELTSADSFDLTVYAVVRGRNSKEWHGLYRHKSMAEEEAAKSNELFPRGHRYHVISVVVKGTAVTCQCGYRANSKQELADHLAAMAHIGSTDQHGEQL